MTQTPNETGLIHNLYKKYNYAHIATKQDFMLFKDTNLDYIMDVKLKRENAKYNTTQIFITTDFFKKFRR